MIVVVQSDMLRRMDEVMTYRSLKTRISYPMDNLQTPIKGQANDPVAKALLTSTEAKYATREAHMAKARAKLIERRRERQEAAHKRYLEGAMLSMTLDFNMKNFADNYTALPTRRILPNMTSEHGGVIFFLHVPKTGGSTIRHNFGGVNAPASYTLDLDLEQIMLGTLMTRVRFIKATKMEAFYEKAVPKINRYLSTPSGKKKLLFVEVHGMDNHNAIELEPFLHAWRERALETKTPFFAFTILREAVSEQISFFNYFYIHPGDSRFCDNSITISDRCMRDARPDFNNTLKDILNAKSTETDKIMSIVEKNRGIDLEDAMMKSIYNNPQCLFLARGERTYGSDASHLREGLSEAECESAYKSLQRTMDWIGRTEKLTSETLPLLTQMMFNNPNVASFIKNTNKSPNRDGFLSLSKIKPSTLEFLKQSSQLDDKLYRHVIKDYRMDQWENFRLG
jgi:hypothetical protein